MKYQIKVLSTIRHFKLLRLLPLLLLISLLLAQMTNTVYTDIIVKITIITRIDVYETLCAQQMLVNKGGKIKSWDGECRDVTPTNCSLKIYLKRALGGGGRVGGVRMDVNEELKFL